MTRIEGKVVAITGAGRGIGAATAQLLAARGARIALGARSEAELTAVSDAIVAAGGEAAWRITDVTRAEHLAGLVATATDRFGRLDVLVANAGVAINAPLHSASPADWDTMIDVNLRGVLHGFAAALPVFRAQGGGHFVTVGSTSAERWVPGQGVYAATKAGVRAVCDVLRQEIAPELRCTFVSPGFTHTDFIASTRDPAELAALTARRDEIAMAPSTVAETIAFAISMDESVDVGELVVRSTAQA